MNQVFNYYSHYYDLLYKDKDYKAEIEYVHNLIQEYNPGSNTVLDFGCGTGHHGHLLCKRGYKVYGIEKSPEMVKQANNRYSSLAFKSAVGDIVDTKLEQTFDAVIALFHVISYQTDNEKLILTFRNANRHLKEKGIFIFDVWYSPAVYYQRPVDRIKRIKDDKIEVIRFAEPDIHFRQNIVDVHYQLFTKDLSTEKINEIKEIHPMRHFCEPEIDLLAGHTGFKVVKTEEFFTGNIPSGETWGVCFVLKKTEK